jgi:hypothetical protein
VTTVPESGRAAGEPITAALSGFLDIQDARDGFLGDDRE